MPQSKDFPQVVEEYMAAWEQSRSDDFTYLVWLNERHDYIMSLAISLWHTASESERARAVAFADRCHKSAAAAG